MTDHWQLLRSNAFIQILNTWRESVNKELTIIEIYMKKHSQLEGRESQLSCPLC
jgi:hypothetical protein